MERIIGDRIGAVLSAKEEEHIIKLLGYGKYVGEHEPPLEIKNCLGVSIRELTTATPKLILDNGDVVWGCECWWANEEIIQKYISELIKTGWSMVDVRIAEFRNGDQNL